MRIVLILQGPRGAEMAAPGAERLSGRTLTGPSHAEILQAPRIFSWIITKLITLKGPKKGALNSQGIWPRVDVG